ncbi:MAG: hypothetical protein ACI9QA_000651 [Methanobacteriota archaeon]
MSSTALRYVTERGKSLILSKAEYYAMTEIVRNEEHSRGAPTVEGTGIRVINIACAYEHNGYSPDEVADFYPSLTLEDVHTALAYYYANVDELRDGHEPTAETVA